MIEIKHEMYFRNGFWWICQNQPPLYYERWPRFFKPLPGRDTELLIKVMTSDPWVLETIQKAVKQMGALHMLDVESVSLERKLARIKANNGYTTALADQLQTLSEKRNKLDVSVHEILNKVYYATR